IDILDGAALTGHARSGGGIVSPAILRSPFIARPGIVTSGIAAYAAPRAALVIDITGCARPAVRSPRGDTAVGVIVSAVTRVPVRSPKRRGRTATPPIPTVGHGPADSETKRPTGPRCPARIATVTVGDGVGDVDRRADIRGIQITRAVHHHALRVDHRP